MSWVVVDCESGGGASGASVTGPPAARPQRPLHPHAIATQGLPRLAHLQLRYFLAEASSLLQLHVSFFVLPFGSMIQCSDSTTTEFSGDR